MRTSRKSHTPLLNRGSDLTVSHVEQALYLALTKMRYIWYFLIPPSDLKLRTQFLLISKCCVWLVCDWVMTFRRYAGWGRHSPIGVDLFMYNSRKDACCTFLAVVHRSLRMSSDNKSVARKGVRKVAITTVHPPPPNPNTHCTDIPYVNLRSILNKWLRLIISLVTI